MKNNQKLSALMSQARRQEPVLSKKEISMLISNKHHDVSNTMSKKLMNGVKTMYTFSALILAGTLGILSQNAIPNPEPIVQNKYSRSNQIVIKNSAKNVQQNNINIENIDDVPEIALNNTKIITKVNHSTSDSDKDHTKRNESQKETKKSQATKQSSKNFKKLQIKESVVLKHNTKTIEGIKKIELSLEELEKLGIKYENDKFSFYCNHNDNDFIVKLSRESFSREDITSVQENNVALKPFSISSKTGKDILLFHQNGKNVKQEIFEVKKTNSTPKINYFLNSTLKGGKLFESYKPLISIMAELENLQQKIATTMNDETQKEKLQQYIIEIGKVVKEKMHVIRILCEQDSLNQEDFCVELNPQLLEEFKNIKEAIGEDKKEQYKTKFTSLTKSLRDNTPGQHNAVILNTKNLKKGQKITKEMFLDNITLVVYSYDLLIPVSITFPNEEQASYVVWFDGNSDFLDNLPERIRKDLTPEIQQFNKFKDDVCNAEIITGESKYLDVWRACSGTLNNMKVYPNPVKENFSIEFQLDKPRKLTFSIHDIYGKRIRDLKLNTQFSEGNHSEDFVLEGVQPGIYLIAVTSDKNERTVQRIIVQQ